MLDELAPHLQPQRIQELEAKMHRHGEQTVPAEWEIAVGYALSTVGKVADPGGEKPGNPDYIFLPRDSKTELLVEVTTLSDKTADAANPVADFYEKLARIAVKEGISPALGAFDWQLGSTEVDHQIVLGIPERRDIDSFFRSREFRSFLSLVKATPMDRRTLRFVARDVESVITFQPGKQFSGGGHRSYKVARRIDDTGVFNALKRKERQLSAFGSDSPGIIFLCDNDSHLLKSSQMYSPGTFRVEEIVGAFLDGRPHFETGPWLIQKGMPKKARRIHAVVTLTVEEVRSGWDPRPRRNIRGRFVAAAHGGEFVRSVGFLALVNEAITALPLPVATPVNAKREYRLPFGFGGWSMSDTKATISLLTLQKLLAGKISYEQFAEAHKDLAVRLRRLDDAGSMISGLELTLEPDKDDDQVTLEFGKLQPERLFDRKLKIGEPGN